MSNSMTRLRNWKPIPFPILTIKYLFEFRFSIDCVPLLLTEIDFSHAWCLHCTYQIYVSQNSQSCLKPSLEFSKRGSTWMVTSFMTFFAQTLKDCPNDSHLNPFHYISSYNDSQYDNFHSIILIVFSVHPSSFWHVSLQMPAPLLFLLHSFQSKRFLICHKCNS